jgi:hypothetical protein
MELNANEIIKALKVCGEYTHGTTCNSCPYMHIELADNEICSNRLSQDALALIKQLTEENEYLIDSLAKQCAENVILTGENKRLRERNITLEQKFIILNREETPIFTVTAQRERTTVIPKSKIDDIYTSGMIDGVRQMQERIKEYFPYDADNGLYVVLDQIAKELIGDE